MYGLMLMLLLILVTNFIKILGAKPWCVCKCKLKAKTVLFVGWLLDVVSCFVFVYVCVFMCVCVCAISAQRLLAWEVEYAHINFTHKLTHTPQHCCVLSLCGRRGEKRVKREGNEVSYNNNPAFSSTLRACS